MSFVQGYDISLSARVLTALDRSLSAQVWLKKPVGALLLLSARSALPASSPDDTQANISEGIEKKSEPIWLRKFALCYNRGKGGEGRVAGVGSVSRSRRIYMQT